MQGRPLGQTAPNDNQEIFLTLDASQVVALNNSILLLFPEFEKNNPALIGNPAYILAKSFFERTRREPTGNIYALENAYKRLLNGLNLKELKNNPFPATFAELIEKFQSVMDTEAQTNAIKDKAQAIFLGEVHEDVADNLSSEIKIEILKVLYCDMDKRGFINRIVGAYGFDEMFKLFALTDEELISRGGDKSKIQDDANLEIKVLTIVLMARRKLIRNDQGEMLSRPGPEATKKSQPKPATCHHATAQPNPGRRRKTRKAHRSNGNKHFKPARESTKKCSWRNRRNFSRY